MEDVKSTNQYLLDRGFAPVVMEKQYHFDQELLDLCPNDVSIQGFFQTEKYFAGIRDVIRKEFTFHEDLVTPIVEFLNELKDPIFLHVRRGDPNLVDARGFKWSYTQCSSQHPPQTLEYYEEPLKRFPEDQEVVIVSDSPEWVMEQELFKPDRFYVSTPEEKYPDGSYTPYVDLSIMPIVRVVLLQTRLSPGGVLGCRMVLVRLSHLRIGSDLTMPTKTPVICIVRVGKLSDG